MNQQRKILLVNPNSKWLIESAFWHLHSYPLTLFASALPRDRFNAQIVDRNLDNHSLADFSQLVIDWSPEVVGFSVLANECDVAGHKAAGAVKAVNLETVIVKGRVYATTRPFDVISDPNIGFVVLGKEEYVFPTLLDFIDGKGDFTVKGVARIVETKADIRSQAAFVEHLNALPYPEPTWSILIAMPMSRSSTLSTRPVRSPMGAD